VKEGSPIDFFKSQQTGQREIEINSQGGGTDKNTERIFI
jgi:hypothetical protein